MCQYLSGAFFVLSSIDKGLPKLGNIVAETLLHAQMFPSLAIQETLLGMQILRLCCKKCFGIKSEPYKRL